jgi:hypothetical protein
MPQRLKEKKRRDGWTVGEEGDRLIMANDRRKHARAEPAGPREEKDQVSQLVAKLKLEEEVTKELKDPHLRSRQQQDRIPLHSSNRPPRSGSTPFLPAPSKGRRLDSDRSQASVAGHRPASLQQST